MLANLLWWLAATSCDLSFLPDMSQAVRALSVPVLGRYWLNHAWQEAHSISPAAGVKHWKQGETAGERLKLLSNSVSIKVANKVGRDQCLRSSSNASKRCGIDEGLGKASEAVARPGAC